MISKKSKQEKDRLPKFVFDGKDLYISADDMLAGMIGAHKKGADLRYACEALKVWIAERRANKPKK